MHPAGIVMIVAALVAGVWANVVLLMRRAAGEPLVRDEAGEPPFRDTATAILVAGTWLACNVGVGFVPHLLHVLAGGEGTPVDSFRRADPLLLVQLLVAVNLVFVVVGPAMLVVLGRHSLHDFGLVPRDVGRALRTGFVGFVAAYPWVLLTIVLTMSYRSREQQNPMLTLVQEQPTVTTVIWTTILVVLLAPLAEELLFRVVLQGWLRNWLRPVPAILITAGVFAYVHGWPDSIALVPLAVVLGWLYEVRNDYLTIVATHAGFNALNLASALLIDPEATKEAEKLLEQAFL